MDIWLTPPPPFHIHMVYVCPLKCWSQSIPIVHPWYLFNFVSVYKIRLAAIDMIVLIKIIKIPPSSKKVSCEVIKNWPLDCQLRRLPWEGSVFTAKIRNADVNWSWNFYSLCLGIQILLNWLWKSKLCRQKFQDKWELKVRNICTLMYLMQCNTYWSIQTFPSWIWL